MFDKRNRWIVTSILAIAALAFSSFMILPVFSIFQQNPQSSSPAVASSPGEELKAQERGYEAVLQREPDNQAALRGLIDTRMKLGNLEATVEPMEKLAELNPDQPEYKVLLAQTKYRLGDREGATQAYRDILSTQPGNMDAMQGLVSLLLEQRRPQAAIGLLQDTLKTADTANTVEPGSIDVTAVQVLLGRVYATENRPDDAIAILDQAIGGNPEDFRPVLAKAIVLQGQGKAEDAKPLFTTAAELAPSQYKDQINQLATAPPPAPAAAPAAAPNSTPQPVPSPVQE